MRSVNLPHEGSQLKKIVELAPWYIASSLLAKAIGFFLLPVYTHYLSPEDFGILANLEAFGRVGHVFLSLSMDAAFIRFYYKERASLRGSVKRLYGTHLLFILVWGGLFSALLIFVTPQLFNETIRAPLWPIVTVIVTQLLNQLTLMVTSIWQAQLEARKLSLLSIVMSLWVIIIGLIFLIPMNYGWVAKIYATGIVGIIQAIFLLSVARKNGWLSLEFDSAKLRRSLLYAIPLVPNIAAGWIAGFSDRWILSYYGRLDETGLYSVAYQISMLLYIFHNAITRVQVPIVMSGFTSNRDKARKQIKEFLSTFIWMLLFMYLCMALFSKELLYLFTDKRFHEAYKLVAILGMVYVLGGVYRVFTTIISFHNKTWVISLAAILQALVNVGFNILFIPLFGMYAAAWSTLLSLAIYTMWVIYWSGKLEPLEIDWRPIVLISSLVMIGVLVGCAIDRYGQIGVELIATKLIILFFLLGSVFWIEEFKPIGRAFVGFNGYFGRVAKK